MKDRLRLRVDPNGRIFLMQTFGRTIRLDLYWESDMRPMAIPTGLEIELFKGTTSRVGKESDV